MLDLDKAGTPLVVVWLQPRKVAIALVCGTGIVVLGAIIARYSAQHAPALGRLFNLDGEASVPAWFSQGMHLVSALLCAYLFLARRRDPARDRFPWLVLAIVFAYTSLDELAAIHEELVAPVQSLTGVSTGALGAGWIFPVVIGVTFLSVLLFRFFVRLPRRTRIGLLIAAGVFFAGAVGVEFIAWSFSAVPSNELPAPISRIYFVTSLFEETLEMLGLVILIYVLLSYVGQLAPRPAISIQAAAGSRREM